MGKILITTTKKSEGISTMETKMEGVSNNDISNAIVTLVKTMAEDNEHSPEEILMVLATEVMRGSYDDINVEEAEDGNK